MSLVHCPYSLGDRIWQLELEKQVLEGTLVEVLGVHALEEGPDDGTDGVHENHWHVNGEYEEGHEGPVPPLAFDPIELSEQAQVPLLDERVEPHSILRHVEA